MKCSFPLNCSSAVHMMMAFLIISCTHEFVESHGKESNEEKKKRKYLLLMRHAKMYLQFHP